MTPICPKCNRVISSADVNVATDVAFCRSCNVAHVLSDMVHGTEPDLSVDLSQPPAGTWHRSTGLGTVIGATHRSWAAAIGALFFGLFWNGIVSIFVALALASTLKHLGITFPHWMPDPKMNGAPMSIGMTLFLWVFLTPFIVIGLAMIGAFLSALGGRTELTVNGMEAVLFRGIGPLGWRKRFRPDSVQEVRLEHRNWHDRDGDRRNKSAIVIELQNGKQLKFGSSLREDRLKFMAAAIRKILVH